MEDTSVQRDSGSGKKLGKHLPRRFTRFQLAACISGHRFSPALINIRSFVYASTFGPQKQKRKRKQTEPSLDASWLGRADTPERPTGPSRSRWPASSCLLPPAPFAGQPPPLTLPTTLASMASRLGGHDVVLALADSRAIPHPQPDLLSALADAARPDLVCAVLRQAADLRSSELLAALRCFLSPASDAAYDAMAAVKGRWKDAAVLAVDKCKDKDAGKKQNAVARRAALLLMMGHDGFTSPEACLHYLFASRTVDCVDSVFLAAAVSELDGEEVAGLMRYLAKWVGKYWRFPEARPCPEAEGVPGLEQCKSVPSLGSVTRAMGLVLDQHFSHLVLNAELREDLCASEVMAKELAVEAESSGPVGPTPRGAPVSLPAVRSRPQDQPDGPILHRPEIGASLHVPGLAPSLQSPPSPTGKQSRRIPPTRRPTHSKQLQMPRPSELAAP